MGAYKSDPPIPVCQDITSLRLWPLCKILLQLAFAYMKSFFSPSRKTDAPIWTATLSFISVGSQPKILCRTVHFWPSTERRYVRPQSVQPVGGQPGSSQRAHSHLPRILLTRAQTLQSPWPNHSCIQA